MNLFALSIGRFGVCSQLIDRNQPGIGKLDVKLYFLAGLHGRFTQLIGFGFCERVAPFRGCGYKRQEQGDHQQSACVFHLLSFFFGGANISFRTSCRNCSIFFSPCSMGGRSSTPKVRFSPASLRCVSRRTISVSFILPWVLIAMSRALEA